jgi:enterochelin esterase-like enzyme
MSFRSPRAILAIPAILGLLACSSVPLSAATVAAPVIELAPLNPQQEQWDCDQVASTFPLCRVAEAPDVATLESMLRKGESLGRAGNELTFAYRSSAQRVRLDGGLQYPLSRVKGTDLWTITLRVVELDRLAFSYFFVPSDAVRERFAWQRWRGSDAPAEPLEVEKVKGRLLEQTIDSKFLSSSRRLTIYEPPPVEGKPLAGVVYAGDGAALITLSRVVEPLITSGRLPRILIVGLHAAGANQRTAEYMIRAVPGNERFLAHERFFLEEVIPSIESQFSLPENGDRRALFGFSASAAWATETALRHPERFRRVIALSSAGLPKIEQPDLVGQVAFFLAAGTLEPRFHQNAIAWSDLLEEHAVSHLLRTEVAGHDFVMWRRLFPEALQWAFPVEGRFSE